MAADHEVRIVICEDSPTYSAALTSFLEHDRDLKVVAVCADYEELKRRLPTARADLVTMDIGLPGLDGLHGTKWIMDRLPLPIVVLSAHAGPGSAPVSAVLAAGALDAIDKSTLCLDERSAPPARRRPRGHRALRARLRPGRARAGQRRSALPHRPADPLPLRVSSASSQRSSRSRC